MRLKDEFPATASYRTESLNKSKKKHTEVSKQEAPVNNEPESLGDGGVDVTNWT